jgi:hypothetical protein
MLSLNPISKASSLPLRRALSIESVREWTRLTEVLAACARAPMDGFIEVSSRLGHSMTATFCDRRNPTRQPGAPIALQSMSCSENSLKQPWHSGAEGSLGGKGGLGGGAANAGASHAGAPGNHPVPGGSTDESTATTAEGTPQSSRDHHLAAAFAWAFAAFSTALEPGSRWPLCSMGQPPPRTQVPASQSGQTPRAGAPGLSVLLFFLAFQSA